MLKRLDESELEPYIACGPLLEEMEQPLALQAIMSERAPADVLDAIESAGLRGRGGGGFPAAWKWRQVAAAESDTKYFVCNANSGSPGGYKEKVLLSRNPRRVIDAIALACWVTEVTHGFLFLGRDCRREEVLLSTALEEARSEGIAGANGRPEIFILRSPGGYITGEETAIAELAEGRSGKPRAKPPLLTASGIFGSPTVVNNIETVLQAARIVSAGVDAFRAAGTKYSPGTMVFCLSGNVRQPGIYELDLGIQLVELLYEHGGGPLPGTEFKAVFPGGVGSRVLHRGQFDVRLEYDALRDIGSDLGSGTVVAVPDSTSMPDAAVCLAKFYAANTCGKCVPCVDGTQRVLTMLEKIEQLDDVSVDLENSRKQSDTRKESPLAVLNNPTNRIGGISYTDTVRGLDKIKILCEFFKYRGDCGYSKEAANSLQALLANFEDEFEDRRRRASAVSA